jgi:TetR/AcrR family transcriptional regulator
MPKPTFLKLPDEKRSRIVEVALDEFATYAYHQASLSRIVTRAGIAKGSMYQYFSNKLDLYRWLVTDELERRRSAWLRDHAEHPAHAERDEHSSLFATLERMALTRVGFLLAHPRLARLAACTLEPSADEELRELHGALRRAHIDELVARIREAQVAGEIRANVEARALAHFIDALIIRGTSNAVLDRLGVEAHQLSERGRALAEGEWRGLVEQALELIRGGIQVIVSETRTNSTGVGEPEDRPRTRAHVN